jgi:hypothetical protein
MTLAISLIVVFAGIMAILILSYERPTSSRRKTTGRGGDFTE